MATPPERSILLGGRRTATVLFPKTLLEVWPPCSAAEVARDDDEDKEPVGHVLTAAERQRRRRRRIAIAARDLRWRWSQLDHLEELFDRSAGAVLRTKPFELWQVVQAQARAEHVGDVVWGWRHPLMAVVALQ